MAIDIIAGPAGGGKSDYISERLRRGLVVLDFTRLFVAISGAERDAQGRYPVRESGDPLLPLAAYLQTTALRQAAARELSGFVTTSDPEAIERLHEAGATGATVTVDPGIETIKARLADPRTGKLSAECEKAIERWYGRG